uniref:Transposable element n=1 Tax=Rhipicephalus zambeziensis TaxID=60191 RepID=A0A224YSU5_9ACAR
MTQRMSLLSSDHQSYTEKKSNSALIYYVAGYVARKIISTNSCPQCAGCLCVSKAEASADAASYFTTHFDNGGLLYPSQNLSTAVKAMEDTFTGFFSRNKLHEASLVEFSSQLQTLSFPQLGCPQHEKAALASVVKFYVLLRFRFFIKGVNKEREARRERQKLLKLRRCH